MWPRQLKSSLVLPTRLESLLALVVRWVDWRLVESASVLGAELQVWVMLSFGSGLLD